MVRRSLLLALATLPLASCGEREGLDPTEARAARAVAAAEFESGNLALARDALAPLIERRSPDPQDLLRGAIVDLALFEPEAAREKLDAIQNELGDRAEHAYCLGLALEAAGDLEAALPHFRQAYERRPESYPTRLKLASILRQLGRDDEAVPHYEALLAVGFDQVGSWHMTVLYQLARILMFQPGQEARARELMREYDALAERKIAVPSRADLDRGDLARLHPPEPDGLGVTATPVAPALTARPPVPVDGVRGLAAVQWEERWSEERDRDTGDVVSSVVGPQQLLAWGPGGLWRVDPAGGSERLLEEPVDLAVVCSLDRDPTLAPGSGGGPGVFDPRPTSLFVVRGSRVSLFEVDGGALAPTPIPDLVLPGAVADAAVVDHDHDGDLDLVVVGAFGARLYRNDGHGIPDAPEPGRFVDATEESGLPTQGAFAWVANEDFDTDGDVDLLLGGPAGALLASNLRGGRFEDASERLGGAGRGASVPVVADLNGDALPDLWEPESGALFRQRPSGRFERDAAGGAAGTGGPATAADVDLDGALDVLAPGAGRLDLGLPQETAWPLPAGAPVVAGDLDGDPGVELAALDGGSVVVHDVQPAGRGLRLALVGVKDNRRGVGAVVEVLAGPIYRRLFWRGEPVTIGLDGEPLVHVVRVRWPNGIVQHLTNVPAGATRVVVQSEGLVGSCPFLYAWNGTRFEFVSDVLGITPLGLPMVPGVLVPPDHDEYVLVRGDRLAPKDGLYRLELTEELREVTYLDRVRLDVVDHPRDVSIWPDERFCFPPFPEPHVHTTRALRAPSSAVDGEGRDWADELADVDGRLAAPFEAYHGQLLGLATPHTLELAFDPGAVAGAQRLRLVMTGWFYWTDASVNVAAARTPGVEFVPPILQVPDGEGGWRDAGPPIGFPAGKTKTMVIDVTGLLDPAHPRLRLFSTLRLYWDSIRLATDADDAPLRTTSLEPASARLWERGYTEPVVIDEEHGLEWFEWERTAEHPRWDQHPGLYTRHGDVLALLGAIDDRFVIMGSGDALSLAFDPAGLPELPEGWTRDFLVFLDGWAKDRDPNTVEALRVEPLPFHGMSAYPYGPDEAFPDDEAHRAWRREWNTRPARAWIEPLAPLARRGYRAAGLSAR